MTGGQVEGTGRRRIVFGHVSALLVILMWGTTFVSTKVLLVSFQPAEIMFFRFLLAYAALWILYPHKPQIGPLRRELLYLLAGLCGVTGYFLMENFALTYSYASNVSILISVAPMVTGIFAHFLLKNERLHWRFFLGFVVAIGGIVLVTLNGNFVLKLNPLGDVLALLAACCWAMYSVIMRLLMADAPHPAACTRHVFFYGLLTMLPVLIASGHVPDWQALAQPVNLLNILFLGLGASALGFVLWNRTVGILGAVKTGVYIYLQPVSTILAAALILRERVTLLALAGTVLILAGLVISESRREPAKTA